MPRHVHPQFTDNELELVFIEFNASLDNGAEDPGFKAVLDKVKAARYERHIRKTRAASTTSEQR